MTDDPIRASEWLLALQDAPRDRALRGAFAAWLDESPEHARDWEEMSHTYAVMGLAVPAVDASWRGFADQRKASRVGWRRALPAMAVGLAVAACLMAVVAPGLLLRFQADEVTATGETRLLRLADGSRVHLAPASAVAMDYGHGERRVRLLKGEAFFDVVHDDAHPFRVTAGRMEAVDVGTSFDIRRHASGVDVAVRSGEVRVEGGGAPVRMEAGAWLSLGEDGVMRQDRRPSTQVAAWQQGEVIVKDAPVAQVVEQIRPYYHGLILVRGERLARQPLTGVYRLADPLAAMQAVAAAQGARVYQVTPWIIVIS